MRSFYRKLLMAQLGKESAQGKSKNSNDRQRTSDVSNYRTILIVDDESSSQELASHILGEAGFKVQSAGSVQEGKELLQSDSDICLVITDLRMPGEDGYSLLEFLKENLRFRHIPAIISSCCADHEHVSRAIEMGAVDYLTKPFDAESLLARVNRTLERSKGIVMLVTEDVVQGSILLRTLTANGFHVLPATTGEDARRLLAEKDVGLVISELALDDMTGLT